MMNSMIRWYVYDNLMRDITINDGKNIELTDCLLQIEKVAAFRNSEEYK